MFLGNIDDVGVLKDILQALTINLYYIPDFFVTVNHEKDLPLFIVMSISFKLIINVWLRKVFPKAKNRCGAVFGMNPIEIPITEIVEHYVSPQVFYEIFEDFP